MSVWSDRITDVDLALGFVTHNEIDSLLGGGAAGSRHRRRLVERGWLPQAPMLRADRHQLAIYPEFALAALVIPAASSDHLKRLVAETADRAARLYRSDAFRRLSNPLVEAMKERGGRDVVWLIQALVDRDRDAFVAWRDEVRNFADELNTLSVSLDASLARIVSTDTGYVIRFRDEKTESYPRENSPSPLVPGNWVTRDRLKVGPQLKDFLLPMPDPDSIDLADFIDRGEASSVEEDDEEAFARALFGGLQGQVRAMTGLPAAREPEDVPEPVGVGVPWELLADANPMTRSVKRA